MLEENSKSRRPLRDDCRPMIVGAGGDIKWDSTTRPRSPYWRCAINSVGVTTCCDQHGVSGAPCGADDEQVCTLSHAIDRAIVAATREIFAASAGLDGQKEERED